MERNTKKNLVQYDIRFTESSLVSFVKVSLRQIHRDSTGEKALTIDPNFLEVAAHLDQDLRTDAFMDGSSTGQDKSFPLHSFFQTPVDLFSGDLRIGLAQHFIGIR